MTNRAKHDATTQPELGFLANHKELLAIRIRPAEFARLLGVSKQTVSTWIRDGKVTINTLDGLLDVRRAIQDVLRNTSPGRLRSRVLRQAVTDALALRQNLASAEDRAVAAELELGKARSMVDHLNKWIEAGDRSAAILKDMIVDRADELRAAPTDTWAAILTRLALDADDAADALPDPADAQPAVVPDGWLADLKLDPAVAAELAAMNAALDTLDAPRATHENGGGGGE
ncbi:MAG: hypothetical protein Q8N48_00170 [Thiobacillus sp.]|nr:hypothetical protein [Thiobacillus sp.]MDP2977226.1 hypothetical protein [Thiobacillus sp.]